MMKKILAAAMMFLAAGPAMAQEWTLSTELGDLPIEALAVAPDGTVWAGQSNSIYRLDNSGWTCITTLTTWTDFQFYGADAPAYNRAYFSGFGLEPFGGSKSSLPTSIYLPLVLKGVGGGGPRQAGGWDTYLYVAPWELSAHLWAVANGSGGYDVWAAGSNGIFASFNDSTSWVSFSDPGINYYSDIDGNGTADIWVAGADSANYLPCLYHYDGSIWTLHTSPYSGGSSPRVCIPSGGPPCCAFGNSTGIQVAEFRGSSWSSLTEIPGDWPNSLSSDPAAGTVWLGTGMSGSGNVYFYDGTDWLQQTSFPAPVWSIDASYPGVVWAATTGAVYYREQPPAPGQRKPWQTDFNGDGTSDIGVFRNTTGMWAIRGVTRIYFGASSDSPVPGDYTGSGTADVAVFRPGTGLWAVRGLTRTYFGSSNDISRPGDYLGDGTVQPAIFRPASGLWAVKGVTRVYFGAGGDIPVSGYYRDGQAYPAIFRYSSGLWAIRGVTRVYFGGPADDPVPGDYSGDGTWSPTVFRPGTGLWAVRGYTRVYFGTAGDQARPGDYSGNGSDDIAVFRSTSGLWAIRGFTRVYFGATGDLPVSR